MRRPASKDRRFKKAQWTQDQKLQAVSTYLMTGSLTDTALITSIPLATLKHWKTADWFKEYMLQLKSEDVQQMSSNMRRIIDKALKATEDRIDLGDAQFDQKTGAIVRIPIKAHVALKISTELLTKQQKLEDNPIREEVEKTIDDRLLKLSEEFSKFASAKAKAMAIDVEAHEVKDV